MVRRWSDVDAERAARPGFDWPPRLDVFVVAEWAEFVGPEPPWWGEGLSLGMSWEHFKARRLWGHARNNWETAAGRSWWGRKPEGRAQAAAELRAVGITPPEAP